MAEGAENGHTWAPTPPWGGLWVGRVTTMLHRASPAWASAMGHSAIRVSGEGLGTGEGPPQGSHLIRPLPAPGCCRGAAAPGGISAAWLGSAPSWRQRMLQSPLPQTPQGHPTHRGAPGYRERGPSAPPNPLTAASAGPATSSRIAGGSAGSS